MDSSGRNDQLDGLRGYAAVAVAIFHTVLSVDPTQVSRVWERRFSDLGSLYERATWILLHTVSGDGAVVVFFVLSGAVLFNSLSRSKGRPYDVAATFLARRALRIYPAMIVCIVFGALLLLITSRPISIDDFFNNIALKSFPIIGATWTLQVELLAAPLLLVTFAGYKLGRETGLLLTGVCIAVLLNISSLTDLPIKNFWTCFIAGMLIPTRAGAALSRWLPSIAWPAIVVVMLFFSGPTTEKICATFVVCKLYHLDGGGLGRLLSHRASVFLGRISYSFYLFNVPIMEWLTSMLRKTPLADVHPLELGLPAAMAVVLFTIPIAYLSTSCIEMPLASIRRRPSRHAIGVAGD